MRYYLTQNCKPSGVPHICPIASFRYSPPMRTEAIGHRWVAHGGLPRYHPNQNNKGSTGHKG